MPGTIRVSVLDFVGLQSSSRRSLISVKVSMGKKEHQILDKGEFSFPLTTLRDTLIVTLYDVEGNEIAHAGVETRLVVEKGIWDDIFPLEGGGHVHMKLQFVLSDDERQRIRTMRESALRKKHDELLNSEPVGPQYAPIVDSKSAQLVQPKHEASDSQKSFGQSEVIATQANWMSTPCSTLFKKGKSSPEDSKGSYSVQNDTDGCEDSSSSSPVSQGIDACLKELGHAILVEKSEAGATPTDIFLKTVGSKDASYLGSAGSAVTAKGKTPLKLKAVGTNDPGKQMPPEKTPSKVRNIISAFESSLDQDTSPKIRPAPTKSQFSRTGEEITLKNLDLNVDKMEKNKPTQSVSGIKKPFSTRNMNRAPAHIRQREEKFGSAREIPWATSSQDTRQLEELRAEHKQTSSEDMVRSSTGERASVSGRMSSKELGRNTSGDVFPRKQHSGGNLHLKNCGKGAQPQNSLKLEAPGYEHYSSDCHGAWIFPGEGKRLCITTAGKQIMNVMVGFWAEAKSETGKSSSSTAENVKQTGKKDGTVGKVGEDEASQRLRISELENSADAETSRGPVEQVMRVAIMIGFATLVLLTRQKKAR